MNEFIFAVEEGANYVNYVLHLKKILLALSYEAGHGDKHLKFQANLGCLMSYWEKCWEEEREKFLYEKKWTAFK